MTNNHTSRKSRAILAGVMPIIRGLMAEPSGNDDRPYQRVILGSRVESDATPGITKPPPLSLSALDYDASPDALTEQLASAVSNYAEYNGGARPSVILLPAVGAVQVVEDPAAPPPPLRNEIAVITGAAGALGSGICRALLENGCRVAATDLPGERLDNFVADYTKTAGDRIIAVPMDVADKTSVEEAFNTIACQWGGVDIAIVNAGIPLISAIVEMDLDDFRRVEQVNVEGTLLTLAEAGRQMRLQGTGGDIIVISTKNVFSPGACFGAYSATKAAAHQLARIASLEFAEYGIRVNMVAPDAVFADGERKSGLWEEIGPDRMRHKGIDEKDLQEYYRGRNLLKARITAQHVANAVLFFVTRQTPTTGATIPVDGGLPDATPR